MFIKTLIKKGGNPGLNITGRPKKKGDKMIEFIIIVCAILVITISFIALVFTLRDVNERITDSLWFVATVISMSFVIFIFGYVLFNLLK